MNSVILVKLQIKRMSKSDTGAKEVHRQVDSQNVVTQSENIRRSKRAPVLSEKMLAYKQEEKLKREKRIVSLYDQWKMEARCVREHLKLDASETQLTILIDTLEVAKNKVMGAYDEFRQQVLPAVQMRRKMDACEAVTIDIIKIVNERITGVDGDFNAERERSRLCTLLDRQYARSIFGSTVSQVSQDISNSSRRSVVSNLEAKRLDAVAEVAAKQAAYNVLMEESKQKEKIKQLEEQHKKALEVELKELAQIQAQKDLKEAQAKLEVYSQEVDKEKASCSEDCSSTEESEFSRENVKRKPGIY